MLFVINLDDAAERRGRMAAQLAALGLPWIRIGFDGRRRLAADIDAHVRAQFPGITFDPDALSSAEVGCWLSHLDAWRHVAASPGAHACAVLEDDVLLDARLPGALQGLVPQDAFDIVYLGTSSRNISTRRRVQVGCCDVHVPVGTVLNTWGYVIRRTFAQRFLATPRHVTLPIDRYIGAGMRYAGARVGVVQPAVVREDPHLGSRSQIEPFTFRVDRWKIVERARRRLLASRASAFYYRLYRWL